VGFEILRNVEFPWPIAQMVYQHHERIDGTGYPRRLSGDDIILEARIIGVADVVEAIAHHRPYRPALGNDVAMEEIFRKKRSHFDPQVVDTCITLFNDMGFKFD
jgi:HD-GYP domain-containing protein (c-di-GMP phosphodiesterase class II)